MKITPLVTVARMVLGGLLRLCGFALNSLYSKIPSQAQESEIGYKERAQNTSVCSFIHLLLSGLSKEIKFRQSEGKTCQWSHDQPQYWPSLFSWVALR